MYRYLSLTSNPLRPGLDGSNLELLARELTGKNLTKSYIEYAIQDYTRVLSPEILAEFALLGLTPKFVVVWSNSLEHRPAEHAMIHTDLTWHNNSWQGVPCGVNWELTPGSAEFQWLANRDQTAIYPPDTGLRLFNAIHYGQRGQRGNYDNFNLIDRATIIGPMLVRTDIPHAVAFDRTACDRRVNISVRFSLDSIGSWAKALELFSTVIK
jgi:hypothetical protein